MQSDKTAKLESLVSSAETQIAEYLKKHQNCTSEELMPYVIGQISTSPNRKGFPVSKPRSIHTLAYLIAYKELEAEGIIKIERGTVPFPMTDNKSIFSLAKP